MILKTPRHISTGLESTKGLPPDEVEIDDAVSADGRVAVAASDWMNTVGTVIDRDQAQQIVDHLTRVFSLDRTVWVLVKSTTETYGHGLTGPVIKLGLQGDYGSEGPSPAFTTEAAAQQYVKDGKAPWGVSPLPLSLLNPPQNLLNPK